MKEVNALGPMVSIGVPTNERPDLLDRTLNSLVTQTYSNIEIIVSDNCSQQSEVAAVLDRWTKRDSRIKVFRQQTNIGALKNFNFVLHQASANWFIWVADDDYLAPWFIEKCMGVLLNDNRIILCSTETQCISADGYFMDDVLQGTAYRCSTALDRIGRMKHLLKYNFGSLIYGLFRKDVLIYEGRVFWDAPGLLTVNEIPPLLHAAYQGEIIVLPDKGIFKTVTENAHAHLKWVARGGRLPQSNRITGIRSLFETWRYLRGVMQGIDCALDQLGLSTFENYRLSLIAKKLMILHFVRLVLTYKPVSKSGNPR